MTTCRSPPVTQLDPTLRDKQEQSSETIPYALLTQHVKLKS